MTITDMPVTLGTAGLLGLYYIYLSARVVKARGSSKISIGDGSTGSIAVGKESEAAALTIACRAHGNFTENVPFALILMGGIEAAGASHIFLLLLALFLIAGRVMHPLGMTRPVPNAFRAGGMILTWATIILACLDALRIAL